MIDSAAMFFSCFRAEGWFHAENDTLQRVSVRAPTVGVLMEIGRPHAGVESAYGPSKGFVLQVLLAEPQGQFDLELLFNTAMGKTILVKVADLCAERETAYAGRILFHKFLDFVNSGDEKKILDIGGRARSGLDRSLLFHSAHCTVLDVLPGDNVDVVGDAHALTTFFAPGSFDAMFSSSVFEHLLMPWVVAAEMSRVLKIGGVAFIATHQTIGMHDMPWDFWRFSDTAWDGLFNIMTGFEILDRALENPQYIIPHVMSRERGTQLEGAVGYVGSSVLVRKIGEPLVPVGPVRISDVISTFYPEAAEFQPAPNIP